MGLRPHYYHYRIQLRGDIMKCADPVLCYTDNNHRKFRHFSLATPFFKLNHNQVFNCGQCLFCRKKKSYELAVRCVLHSSMYKQNSFLTLTYDEKKPTYHNNFDYTDIQKFKKRLRQHCSRHYNGKKIEIFNVHEYGKNGKKHWHLVLFNHDFSDKQIHTTSNSIPLFTSKTLEKLWPFGFNTIGDVTEASAMYQAQYTQKDIKNGNTNNSKKADSKHSGIGKPYFLKHYAQILSLGYIPFNGRKIPIPRAFQKIAHKHFSHFYEPENFFDTPNRKALYRPFKQGLENEEIAELYIQFKYNKEQYIKTIEEEWDQIIHDHIYERKTPDFIIAADNALYDLNKKLTTEKF